MCTVTIGSTIDFGAILQVVGTLVAAFFGVWFGWFLQKRREHTLTQWRTRAALTLVRSEIEAIFQTIEPVSKAPTQQRVTLRTPLALPSFHQYVGEL